MSRGASETCHASCVLLGEDGVLIRGPSGAGKSALSLALIDRDAALGLYARMVADDRVVLQASHGRLVARAHPELAGLLEVRGSGVLRCEPFARAAVVRLVVDLVPARPRMPEVNDDSTELLGLRLPVLRLEPRQPREYLLGRALVALQRRRCDVESVSRQTHPPALSTIDDPTP